jgi:PBP1b-binding outer membrane lipoprotein LpoB
MGKLSKVILALLMVSALTVVLVGCDSGSDTTNGSQPAGETGDTINSVKQQANSAAREANLRMIDSAIQMYYTENNSYPTSINQLSQYFSGGVPSDPAGGTYYIKVENGAAKAAVR